MKSYLSVRWCLLIRVALFAVRNSRDSSLASGSFMKCTKSSVCCIGFKKYHPINLSEEGDILCRPWVRRQTGNPGRRCIHHGALSLPQSAAKRRRYSFCQTHCSGTFFSEIGKFFLEVVQQTACSLSPVNEPVSERTHHAPLVHARGGSRYTTADVAHAPPDLWCSLQEPSSTQLEVSAF